MEPILLLITSAPSSADAQRAWQTARTLSDQGHPVTLFLLQDGVLAGLEQVTMPDLPPDIRCHVLDEDLALRGFAPLDLHKHVEAANYGKLIDLFDDHTRVIGAL